ncbi:MAG: YfhO family protein [Candidatus Eisenbacteria bacterium]|uniref:YfhO family protein n=1 Tax=Eiseniibacteriota bacterium TaxID=2212470 RepID=A0A956NIM9_UNCEI|nr:YfhO family protein [Candidatus Eisenbacteria bacterium]
MTTLPQAILLVLVVVAPVFVLFAPSFIGQKLLLPLDVLALDGVYLSEVPPDRVAWWGSSVLADQVLEYEMNRRFVTDELRAGRVPLWNPYGYCGAPFANFHKYSPFMWPYYLFGTPRVLPWIQLLVAFTAGIGTYVYGRRGLGVGYYPALVAAAAFPLVGFFVLWRGFSLTYVAAWLPWLFLAIDATVRRPVGLAPVGLAVVTALVLVSGQIDVAGQALLASGVYAVGCSLLKERGKRPVRRLATVGLMLTAGWGVGFLLSAPYLLPLADYARTGARFQERAAGSEERPPIGLPALPALLLPDAYGTSREGSFYLLDGNQLEGPAAGYAGVVLVLFLAPLAFVVRERRKTAAVLLAIGILGLSWDLDVPGAVQLLRLPVLNLMSHNRFVFVSAFAWVALAALGFEQVLRRERLRLPWLLGAVAPFTFGVWCLHSMGHLPEPVGSKLGTTLVNGRALFGSVDSIRSIQESYVVAYARGALLCLAAVAGWVLVVSRFGTSRWLPTVLAVTTVAELLGFAIGVTPQSDPAMYYPEIEALTPLRGTPDRVLGLGCLPANLNERFRLREVRGYDGVDPARMIELLELCRDVRVPAERYGRVQVYSSPVRVDSVGTLACSPVLDMLAVRHIVVRGEPPAKAKPVTRGSGYWTGLNPRALPRAFVPERIETTKDDAETLRRLGDPGFDPRGVAFITTKSDWSGCVDALLGKRVSGRAEIESEDSGAVTVITRMETSGLMVLGDLFDDGWKATVNGQPMPILRVNHAIRGVVVPEGRSTVRFDYRPSSFVIGVGLAIAAAVALILWSAGIAGWRVGHRLFEILRAHASAAEVPGQNEPGPATAAR